MAGICSKAANISINNEKTFQGQKFDNDLGVNYYGFKWRNHDPQIGRFIEIDPLSADYVYNSTYAFSENKVTNHVELEGLEASPAAYLQAACGQITTALANTVDRVASFFTKSEAEFEMQNPSNPSNSQVTTLTSTTTFGTNLLGFVQHSAGPGATVSNGPSLFKAETKTELKVENKQTATVNNLGTVTLKQSIDGSSQEAKGDFKLNFRKIPITLSVTGSQNFATGEDKVKVRVAVTTPAQSAFGQLEVATKDNKITVSASVGVTQTTATGKNTFSIGKVF